MKLNRIGRIVVCLLLICCILVNLSPLKAHALDPVTVGFVGVSAVVGVACIMQALGYMAASNSEPFTNSVNACVDYLTESTSFVTNGMLTFAGYRSGQLSSMYAMRDLVQEIWQWLFDSTTVYTVPPASHVTNSLYNEYKDKSYSFSHSVNTFAVATDSIYCKIWAISNSPFARSSPGYNDATSLQSGSYYYMSLSNFKQTYISDQYQIIDQSVVSGLSTDEIVSGLMSGSLLGQSLTVGTDVDISLGQIESPYQTVGTDEEIIEIEIAPVYIDLTKEVQEFPDPNNPSDDPDLDKKIPWLPIRIPSKNYDDTVINQTQQESWTGESDVEFEFDYGDSSGDGSGNTGSDTGTESGNQIDYTSWFQKIIKGIEELPSKFESWISDCKTAIEELPSKFADWFNSIIEKLSSIWETLKSIPQTILDGLRNILTELFVPQEDYISDKVTSLRERFSFADSIMETGRAIGDSLSFGESEPPVIYIHLGDTEASYNIGGTVPFLDMRWYARYKPTGDVLLSSLIWVFFAWRCFVHAPNIISGIAGDVEAFNIPDGGGMYLSGSPYAGSDFEKPKRGKFERRKNGRR